MRLFRLNLIILSLFLLISCTPQEPMPSTPLETLKAYTVARKKKEPEKMKLFLSKGSLKMSEDEAKAQNRPLDEVILNETLIAENQREVKFRNEKIEGESARIEIQNMYGSWDVIPFIKESGYWKIAKEKFAEERQRQVEEEMKKMDQQINETFQTVPTPIDDTLNQNKQP